MKNTTSYKEFKDAGYREVWGIGNKDTLFKYCRAERLLMTKVVDIDTALYSKERPEGFVIDLDIEKEEKIYLGYKLGCRGFVVFLNGFHDPLIDYLVEREKKYWERAREIGREKRRESGNIVSGHPPYGYYLLKGKMYIDKYESFIVKFVFYRYSQGCKFPSIAKELNIRGFRNRKGNPFKAGSIESIIKNRRIYQGYLKNGDSEVKGDFKGILEDSEDLLTKDWINRVFDAETEAKISRHASHAGLTIKPYVLVEGMYEGKEKLRKVRNESKRSI